MPTAKVDLVMRETDLISGPQGDQTVLADNYLAVSQVEGTQWSVNKLKLTPPGPGGGLFFLDVNGDGLPDAVETVIPPSSGRCSNVSRRSRTRR